MLKGVCRRANPSLELGMTLPPLLLLHCTEAAPGVDGVRWEEYGEELEGRLPDLHRRVHTGAYRATPSRRVNIPKPDGGTRPLGVAALEDKIVQKAVVDNLLTPIYEAEFLGFSYGFRPGRGAHDALDAGERVQDPAPAVRSRLAAAARRAGGGARHAGGGPGHARDRESAQEEQAAGQQAAPRAGAAARSPPGSRRSRVASRAWNGRAPRPTRMSRPAHWRPRCACRRCPRRGAASGTACACSPTVPRRRSPRR